MKILVPMGGSGQRFRMQGYAEPKPLIRIGKEKRRIIEHVLDSFTEPGEDFIFICNKEHIADTAKALSTLKPGCAILPTAPHRLGPVHTLREAYPCLDDKEEVIVAYCDGAIRWDREAFKSKVKDLDGCLFTHTGFHPHSLSNTKMAYIREENGRVLEVKEKASFTEFPHYEHASSGFYYFKEAAQMVCHCERLVASSGGHNGEYYVTLVYNELIKSGLNVGFFDTDYFACLGTPEEVRMFEAWEEIVQNPNIVKPEDVLNSYYYWKRHVKSANQDKKRTQAAL